jgi:cytochrome c-type biogenesis protein CcmH
MYGLNAFWFVAGALCGAGALLLVLRATRDDRSQAVARFPLRAALAGVAGVAIVVGLYLWLGRPDLLSGQGVQQPEPQAAGAGAGAMDAAIAGLESRLAQGAGSEADWSLLAQSYEFLGRSADAGLARSRQLPAKRMVVVAPDAAAQELIQEANTARRARKHAAARDAYVKLVARGAMTADTWADYADVTASLRGGTLAGEAGKYIARALELDPRHAKALWLQGSLLHETGRHSEAVAVWERLASVLDPGTSDARLVADNIAEDRRLGGSASGSAASTVKPAAAAAAVAVSGEVVVAEALKSQVTAGQTVFIYAKAAGQSAPPVAALRTASGAWPLRFRLDDSLSMMPSRPLSAAGKLIIEARISRSGEATAMAGDLQGTSGVIDPKSGAPLRLLIDRVVN